MAGRRSSLGRGTTKNEMDEDSLAKSSAREGPHPEPIVLTKDDHTFELNVPALEAICYHPEVKDRRVAVVAVAGAFRKGKSFLLDFFIRYLEAVKRGDSDTWMGDEERPLLGFHWRGGPDRDTTGILMWSEPFLVTRPSDGMKIAVLLMDTQGAFDRQSTVRDCATIFALSTMLSSLQVYNLTGNIQEDDLQHLHMFTEYGRLALEENSTASPFQSLVFLVRDWSYPYSNAYGFEGGTELLEKWLQVEPTQHKELQMLRADIRGCFEQLKCFLMPHPGLEVATNPTFDGRLSKISDDFKQHLKTLVPRLLRPSNLVTKEINGAPVTGLSLVEYFKVYMKIYQGSTLPEPKSMLMATAEASNLAALATSKEFYSSKMEELCGGEQPYLQPEQLQEAHETYRRQANELFTSAKTMGRKHMGSEYVAQLEEYIADCYENHCKANKAKNIFVGLRTPLTLLLTSLVLYFLNGLFSLVGLESLAGLCQLVLFLAVVLFALWGYTGYTGELREVGSHIDRVAAAVWETLFATAIEQAHKKGMDLLLKHRGAS